MGKREMIDNLIQQLSNRGIKDFEIYLLQSKNLSIEVQEGEVDSFNTSDTMGLSLRVIKENRMGFSYCTHLESSSIPRLVEDSLTGALSSSPDEFYSFPEASSNYPILNIFDNRLSQIRDEEKAEKAKELEKQALSYDKRIAKIRKASYNEGVIEAQIINSKGIDVTAKKTLVSMNLVAIAKEGEEEEQGWDMDFSPYFHEISTKKVAERAVNKALSLLGAKTIETRKCPVILDSLVASEFLDILAPSFLAENIYKGKSLLKDKINIEIFSPHVSIVDNGIYPRGMASFPFDGEGFPAGETMVVEKGVLKSYLADQFWSKKTGFPLTGNSHRGSLKSPPGLGISNFYIEAGNISPQEMISSLTEGMMITELLGVHTANPISGEFSLGVSGSWIKGGIVQFPVKGIAISGNILNLFKGVELVGNDLRFYGNLGSPSLLVKEMDLAGKR